MTPAATTGLLLVLVGIAGVLGTYVGYPLWLACRRRVVPATPRAAGSPPPVRILLPAHNEEEIIGAKLENLLRESHGLECDIVVIDDGSTDATADVVASFSNRGVGLLRIERCRGKNEALNEAMRRLAPHPPLVATTDADALLAPGALRHLLAVMADERVGTAAARVVYDGGTGGAREQRYFGYENLVRRLESSTGACVSLGGQFEIHRTQVWRELPADTATDMAAALLARAAGLWAVQVDDAVVYTGATGRIDRELGRKRRTIRRGLAAAAWLWPHLSLDDRIRILGHKVSRYLLPAYQLAILLGAALLTVARPAVGAALLGGQVVVYAATAWGLVGGSAPSVLRNLAYYQMVHVVALRATFEALTGAGPHPAWSRAR